MSTKSTTGPKPACEPSATPPDAAVPSCPPPEAVLALMSGRFPADSDVSVLLHIARCRFCRAALSFVAEAALRLPAAHAAPPALRTFADRRLASCLAAWRRRAAAGADAIAACAANESRLLFRSVENAPPGREWKAELVLPVPGTSPSSAVMRMLPARGRLPSRGRFVVFGFSAPLRGNAAVLPPDVLAYAAPDSGGVSFVAADGVEIPGVPVFDAFSSD